MQYSDRLEIPKLEGNKRHERSLCNSGTYRKNKASYSIYERLLYRKDKVLGQTVKPLLVQKERRADAMRLAHESIGETNFGARKTKQRILYTFYLPTVMKHVKLYCASGKKCDSCRRIKRTLKDKVPIQ